MTTRDHFWGKSFLNISQILTCLFLSEFMSSAFLCFVSLLLASNKWQCWSHPKFTCFDRCSLALLITVFWIWSSRSGRSACCCGNSWPAAPRLTPMWTPSTSLSSSCKDEDCYSQSSARTHCKCTHTHTHDIHLVLHYDHRTALQRGSASTRA